MAKIVHISTVSYPHNGVGGVMRSLCRHSGEHGHQASVAAGFGPEGDFCFDRTLPHYFAALGARLFDNDGLSASRNTRRLLSHLDKIEPDILHLHNLHGYYIDISMLSKWIADSRVALVVTMHDCWLLTGHCCYFTMSGCQAWSDGSGCRSCAHLDEYPRSWVFGRGQRNIAAKCALMASASRLQIVAPSQWMARLVERSHLAGLPVAVIPNGIEPEAFTPKNKAPKTTDGRIKVLSVASPWFPRKNIEALSRLADLGHEQVDVIVVGDASMAKKVSPRVAMLGRITDRGQMARLYADADVVAVPSREESFGMTVLEAVASGTPVVANKATALPEVMGADYGIVVDADNTRQLLDAVRRAATIQPRLRDEHRASVMTRRYSDIYNDLMGM